MTNFYRHHSVLQWRCISAWCFVMFLCKFNQNNMRKLVFFTLGLLQLGMFGYRFSTVRLSRPRCRRTVCVHNACLFICLSVCLSVCFCLLANQRVHIRRLQVWHTWRVTCHAVDFRCSSSSDGSSRNTPAISAINMNDLWCYIPLRSAPVLQYTFCNQNAAYNTINNIQYFVSCLLLAAPTRQ